MTLSLAEECLQRIKAKAKEMGAVMSIAVVDEAGALMAYARMRDNPGMLGERLPVVKAKTAVAYRRSTQDSLERFAAYPGNNYIITMSAMYPGEFCVTPGGVPILADGEVIGGVGVSGSTPENDHQCAKEALDGLKVK